MSTIFKKQLMRSMEIEFKKLLHEITFIGEDEAERTLPGDEESIKYIIFNRTQWIQKFFHWYDDSVADKSVCVPSRKYNWNQLDTLNQIILHDCDSKLWHEVHDGFITESERLLDFVRGHSEEELNSEPRFKWMDNLTLGQWIEMYGVAHLKTGREKIRYIQNYHHFKIDPPITVSKMVRSHKFERVVHEDM